MSTLKRLAVTLLTAPTLLTPALAYSVVHAAPANGTPVSPVSDTATTTTSSDTQRLSTIKSKGDSEIDRRLKVLNTLASKINAATKLTASDKATLTAEISTEISGLTALKTKLDGETTLSAAIADVQSMVTEYRVYALIVPKIHLIRMADDQQAVESKLTALATKLNTRITAAQTAGKDVSTLQTQLAQLNQQIATAQAISSSVETKVITLQPTDYNNDHTLLAGYVSQLTTAHQDNQAAYQLAKTIVAALKSLS